MFWGVPHLRLNVLLVHSFTQSVSEGSPEKQQIDMNIYIYCRNWLVLFMEAKKFHNVPPPSCSAREASGVTQCQFEGRRWGVWAVERDDVGPGQSLKAQGPKALMSGGKRWTSQLKQKASSLFFHLSVAFRPSVD